MFHLNNLEQSNEENILPNVEKGDNVKCKKATLDEKLTKAPPVFNEASLLAAMETAGRQVENEEMREAMKDCGLGTPATRASIIEKLINVEYIKRDGRKLIPTDKGYKLVESIIDEELLSPEMTGNWEKKLNDIFKKTYSRKKYMKEINNFVVKIIDNAKNIEVKPIEYKDSLGKCPVCGGSIIENKKAYGCSNWKDQECKFVVWKEIANKKITKENIIQLLKKRRTNEITNFKSKKGNVFNAILILNKENMVEMEFSND